METSPFRSWSGDKGKIFMKKYDFEDSQKIKKKYSVLKNLKKSSNTSNIKKKSVENSVKKTKLKLAKKTRLVGSFMMSEEKPVEIKIGKITKNFLRDEYQYRGKQFPKESSLKKSTKVLERRKGKKND